jgi:hypothetical protein
MAGIFPNETSVYIVAAGTNGSALTAADKVVGEITNWSQSGMDRDVESIPVIGGYVDKENPRSQGEISFDVIVQNTAASTLDRWNTYAMSSGLSSDEPVSKAIFIYSTNSSTHLTLAINNATLTSMERTMDADDMLRYSVTFKFSPTTALGTSNLKSSSLVNTSTFFNW